MSGIRTYFPRLLLTFFLTYAVIALQATAHGAAKENAVERFLATSLWPKE
jgi:Na+-driven multidrug efflux pump